MIRRSIDFVIMVISALCVTLCMLLICRRPAWLDHTRPRTRVHNPVSPPRPKPYAYNSVHYVYPSICCGNRQRWSLEQIERSNQLDSTKPDSYVVESAKL